MPNFFKKLTGSLKMPEDDNEFFEEEAKEEVASQENTGFTPEPENIEPASEPEEKMPEEVAPAYEPEVEQKPALEPETETPSETVVEEDDDLEIEEEEEYEEPEAESSEEGKPYTIAQLAQATTAKTRARKSQSKSTLGRLKPFAKKSKKVEKKEVEAEPEGQLAIDVYETPSDIIIKSTIAGVDPKDLDIGIEENTINIRGSRHAEHESKGADYFYQECYWGTFSRSVILPVEVDSDKTDASLKNGVLTIKLPKIKKEKEKKIKVLG